MFREIPARTRPPSIAGLVYLLALGACPPPKDQPDPTATDTGPAGSSAMDSSTGGTGFPGMPLDDPCMEWDESSCPKECVVVTAYQPSAEDPCAQTGAVGNICISVGPGFAAGHRTTFFGPMFGQTVILIAGAGCISGQLPGPALYWHECTGTGDEPAACGCLCGANGCPYKKEIELLDSCGYAQVCAEPGPGLGLYTGAQICALTAARDRTPGLVEWRFDDIAGLIYRVYIEGESAQWSFRKFTDFCTKITEDEWTPVQRCQLKPAAYFQGCLDAPAMECTQAHQWFESCAVEAATCP